MDHEDLNSWVGRRTRATDVVTAAPARLLAATLGRSLPEDGTLPLLWHWLYFLDTTPTADLAADGHARRGRFLPPVSQRRRMFGGSRVAVHAPLHLGDPVERTSTIAAVAAKQGRQGPLTVVSVRHEVAGPAGPALIDEQDILYVDAPPARAPAGETDAPPARAAAGDGDPPAAPWGRRHPTDEVLLFRFSALTFNAHRIHYDAAYASTEGYPALVVHGPLVALLLAGLAEHHGVAARRFWWKARSPFYCGDEIHLRGSPEGAMAAYSAGGGLRVEAGFTV